MMPMHPWELVVRGLIHGVASLLREQVALFERPRVSVDTVRCGQRVLDVEGTALEPFIRAGVVVGVDGRRRQVLLEWEGSGALAWRRAATLIEVPTVDVFGRLTTPDGGP